MKTPSSYTGIVKFFLPEKGYGYIQVATTKEEIYVHQKKILETIKTGDSVRFEIREDRHGLFAAEVKLET